MKHKPKKSKTYKQKNSWFKKINHPTLYYKAEMVKKRGKILWQALEMPTKSIIIESFFEEDVKKLVKFQNKHKVWQDNGGIPRFFCHHFGPKRIKIHSPRSH